MTRQKPRFLRVLSGVSKKQKVSALLRAYDNVLLRLYSSDFVSFVFRLRLKMAWRSAPTGEFQRQWNPLDIDRGRISLSYRDL